MLLRLLGPVEVVDGARTIEVHAPRERKLIAALATHLNRPLDAHLLIDMVWDGSPPRTAAKTLQTYVHHLRRQLAPVHARMVVETTPSGYRLVADPQQVDIYRFQSLAEAGRREAERAEFRAAATALRGALELWQADPCAELELVMPGLDARLRELRVGAYEDCLRAEIELGRLREAVSDLEALVCEHPERERLWELLGVALYRSGRQSDALATYQRARAALVVEVGVEPGEALRALHNAILQQDPYVMTSTAPSIAAAGASDGGPAFVGRGNELARIDRCWATARSGRCVVVVVTGDAGVGKSSLLTRASERMRAQGLVLSGRCDNPPLSPYQPIVEWLHALTDPARVDRARVAATMLGEQSFQGGQHSLFIAACDAVDAAAAAQPVAAFIDDVHWASSTTMQLVRFLVLTLAGSPLLVVLTRRPGLPNASDAAVAELLADGLATEIQLRGLEEPDVSAWLQRELARSRYDVADISHRLWQRTRGNPLFLREYVTFLRDEHQPGEDLDFERAVPRRLRDILLARAARQPAAVRDLLAATAVVGESEPSTIAAVANIVERDRASTLEGTLSCGLAELAPTGRLRLSHPLIREVLYDNIDADGRRQLHARAGDQLETISGMQLADEIAHHRLSAATGTSRSSAIKAAVRAGRRAATAHAPAEAVEHLGRALALLDEVRRDELDVRIEVLAEVADAEWRAGHAGDAARHYEELLRLGVDLDRADLVAKAALGMVLLLPTGKADRELGAIVSRMLDARRDLERKTTVDLLIALTAAWYYAAEHTDEVRSASEAAIEIARDLRDPHQRALALRTSLYLDTRAEHLTQRLRHGEELVTVAGGVDDVSLLVRAYVAHIGVLVEAGRFDEVRRMVRRLEELAREHRTPHARFEAAAYQAMLALAEGRLADAEMLTTQAVDIGSRFGVPNTWELFAIQAGTRFWLDGKISAIVDEFVHYAATSPDMPAWKAGLAFVLAEGGRLAEARIEFEHLARAGFESIPPDENWSGAIASLAVTVHDLNDRRRAEELYDLLVRSRACFVNHGEGVLCWGSVGHYLGLLALTLDRRRDAADHFGFALEQNQARGLTAFAELSKAALRGLHARAT